MKRQSIVFLASAGLALALSLGSSLLVSGRPALAQQEPARDTAARDVPLAEALAEIGRDTGTVVLADSTVAQIPIRFRAAPNGTVEQRIKQVVRLLPNGTIWAKLYVPKPSGERWNADDVAQYARSLAQLTGRQVGGASPEGTLNVMGRPIPQAEAESYIRGLDLKRVYLVSNPSASQVGVTPERIQQVAQQFRAMDPANRIRWFMEMEKQQHDMIKMLFEGMSDQERVEFKRGLSEAMGHGDIHVKIRKP